MDRRTILQRIVAYADLILAAPRLDPRTQLFWLTLGGRAKAQLRALG